MAAAGSLTAANPGRTEILLSDAPWQFTGAPNALPDIGTPDFDRANWTTVRVPHVLQHRTDDQPNYLGWYRRDLTVPPELAGKRLYIVCEGAATVADVYVNGMHLGQHTGAYTRFIFDATDALHAGAPNTLAIRVDNSKEANSGSMPSGNRLYWVWGGLYRKVWLMATDPRHIDPTDFASPGVYITPSQVSESGADLSATVLLRNAGNAAWPVEVKAALLDPAGKPMLALQGRANVAGGQRGTVKLSGHVSNPRLWAPGAPNLYHLRVDALANGAVVDTVTEPTGFRALEFKDGLVYLNGKRIVLNGPDLHQEIETKASAMSDDDFRKNWELLQDMGANFVRLSHYPRARVEYDLCDQLGLFCWTENGHTNSDAKAEPAGIQITTEMVKQNYNHPSIAVWSAGNEASAEPAEEFVKLIKSLDPIRPVGVANMKCQTADFHGANTYPGWYGGDTWKFKARGYITETGAGGSIATHCDYALATWKVNSYEPEEYQQIVGEQHFQSVFREDEGKLGMFSWWCMRDFCDHKYLNDNKAYIWNGVNSKGLITYDGEKKDIYYLYRSFLRPGEPTVHLASKRYFLRQGAVDNGIKAYGSAKRLTLTLNGKVVSTLDNGNYTQSNGARIDNVFFWSAPLRTGRNEMSVTDGAGHSDSAVVYFEGEGGQPESPAKNPLVKDLTSSNPANRAYYMDMPVQPHWPIYYDFDSTGDNRLSELPEAVTDATWIATRRLTKAGQETDLSFTVTRPATVLAMVTKAPAPPVFLTGAGFNATPGPDLTWHDNRLLLVPAQLYSRTVAAGERVMISKADRDALVMIKEK
jgi:beta-galactosidase